MPALDYGKAMGTQAKTGKGYIKWLSSMNTEILGQMGLVCTTVSRRVHTYY